jgi:hypothetical protein
LSKKAQQNQKAILNSCKLFETSRSVNLLDFLKAVANKTDPELETEISDETDDNEAATEEVNDEEDDDEEDGDEEDGNDEEDDDAYLPMIEESDEEDNEIIFRNALE